MKLVPENGPWPRLLVFPVLIVVLAALGVARLWPDLIYRLAHCPLRDTTGIPCLTCGGTHSLVAMTNGQWIEAMAANPLVVLGTLLILPWSAYALTATVVPRLRRSMELAAHEKIAARWVAAILLIGTWIWEFRQFC